MKKYNKKILFKDLRERIDEQIKYFISNVLPWDYSLAWQRLQLQENPVITIGKGVLKTDEDIRAFDREVEREWNMIPWFQDFEDRFYIPSWQTERFVLDVLRKL